MANKKQIQLIKDMESHKSNSASFTFSNEAGAHPEQLSFPQGCMHDGIVSSLYGSIQSYSNLRKKKKTVDL